MSSNVVRMTSQPSQRGWVWDGSNWCWSPDLDDCPPCPPPVSGMPFPCPPSGFPTPCPPWFPPPAGQAPWYPGANGGVSFSATPPVNPIRGNFWWDGALLHLFDGAVWVSIGPGAAGAPGTPSGGGAFVGANPPAAPTSGTQWWNGTVMQVWDGSAWRLVGPSGAASSILTFAMQQPSALTVSGTTGTWSIVPYAASPQVDTQTAWDPASHRLTPKVAGNYFTEVRAIASTNAALAIVKNDSGSFTGTLGSDIVVAVANGSGNTWITAGGIANMNGTTDYVRVWSFATGGSLPAAGSSPVYAAVLM